MGLCAHLPHNVRGFIKKGRERGSVESRREEVELRGGGSDEMITWDVLTAAGMERGDNRMDG